VTEIPEGWHYSRKDSFLDKTHRRHGNALQAARSSAPPEGADCFWERFLDAVLEKAHLRPKAVCSFAPDDECHGLKT
jgi:hypothetical protein